MHTLRTAILEHTTAVGVHYDWLIEDPTLPDPHAPDARLWTARVSQPPKDWPELERFEIEMIAPHRRLYLTYQGQVPGNRGRVRRVAEGVCRATLWAEDRIMLALQTQQMRLELRLTRRARDRWVVSK